MAAKMPPMQSPEQLQRLGRKVARALDKSRAAPDEQYAAENKADYQFGKKIKGKYFKGKQKS
jgi:hypothetical protein